VLPPNRLAHPFSFIILHRRPVPFLFLSLCEGYQGNVLFY
jgi:hypothetical protein